MSARPIAALAFKPQQVRLLTASLDGGRVLIERADTLPAAPPLKAVERCIAALPREEAFSRVLTLPTADDAELRSMVELQAKGLLPIGQAELVLDFVPLRRTATHTTVVLFGVARPVIDKYLARIHPTGVAHLTVTLTTSGLLRWYAVARATHGLPETAILLELDASSVECLIIRQGALAMTRSIPLGAPAWLDELERTVDNARKETDVSAEAIVLTGDASVIAQWQPAITEWSRIPVRAVDQWSVAAAAPGVRLPLDGAWSAVVGCLLPATGQPLLNLLPAEARRRRQQRTRERAWLVTAALAAAWLLVLAACFGVAAHRQEQLAATLHAASAHAGPQAKALAHDMQRIQRLRDQFAERGAMLRALEALYQATPPDIVLTQLSAEPTREVRLRGIGPSIDALLAYVTALEESPALVDVHLRYSTERATAAGAQVEFEVVCRLAPERAAR